VGLASGAMADWQTISSLATAGGTLVLAAATFTSVRSANQAARVAERALLAGLRPLLLAARPQDPTEKVTWFDEHRAHVPGGRAVVEETNGAIYLAATLRNVGAGVAVLHGWHFSGDGIEDARRPPADPSDFRRLTRDLYIGPGDTGFWQGAMRDPDDPDQLRLSVALTRHDRLNFDVLYGDQEGGQRTITRLGLTAAPDGSWLCSAARHWNLDRADPR
jgi:hypothetical protein